MARRLVADVAELADGRLHRLPSGWADQLGMVQRVGHSGL